MFAFYAYALFFSHGKNGAKTGCPWSEVWVETKVRKMRDIVAITVFESIALYLEFASEAKLNRHVIHEYNFTLVKIAMNANNSPSNASVRIRQRKRCNRE